MGQPGRKELIQKLWPDKALFSATLLMLTALLGVLHGLAFSFLDIQVGEDEGFIGLVKAYPPLLVLVLSAIAAICAYFAMTRYDTRLALVGAVAGILSLGLFGLGSLLALVAVVFAALSAAEGEDQKHETRTLHALAWPDKALAASAVQLVMGVLTIGWGIALAMDAIAFSGYTSDPQTFGLLAIAAGALGVVSSWFLYHQRAPWLGVLGAIAGILALGLYAVGPILGIIALALIVRAWKEREFRHPAPA